MERVRLWSALAEDGRDESRPYTARELESQSQSHI